MHLQLPCWNIILAVLGLFQSALKDRLLNLAAIQMNLPILVVPQPQPDVEHAAVPTTR